MLPCLNATSHILRNFLQYHFGDSTLLSESSWLLSSAHPVNCINSFALISLWQLWCRDSSTINNKKQLNVWIISTYNLCMLMLLDWNRVKKPLSCRLIRFHLITKIEFNAILFQICSLFPALFSLCNANLLWRMITIFCHSFGAFN